MTETRNETTDKLAKDLIPIDDIEISGHALERFTVRISQNDLVEASRQIRSRLGNSHLTERPDWESLKETVRPGDIFFQDAEKEGFIYVCRKKKKKGSYVLITVMDYLEDETVFKLIK